MHETQEIWHKESLFQQYIFSQSQHQRHTSRGKHSFNTSFPPSSSIYAFKLNNKEMKTSTQMLLVFFVAYFKQAYFAENCYVLT